MKKYVDGCEFCNNCQNKKNRCAYDCVLPDYLTSEWERVIEEQPTVDAVPVKHGKWTIDRIDTYDLAYGTTGYEPVYRCSVCGLLTESYLRLDEPIMPEDADFPNYCPNCGAKMDGADGERR
jgi:hypothetical protein